MKELSSAFMKKHLRLFNKMVRAETYKDIAKMDAKKVREVFKRDFRETVSGKDGKTFYSPRKYEIDLDSGDDFTSEFKKLSTDKPKSKPKKKAEPKKAEKKFKGVSPEPSKKSKEIEKERSRLLDVLEKYPSFKDTPRRGTQSKHELYTFLIYDAKTIKSLKEVERLIERAGKKEEPKKAEKKNKGVAPEPKLKNSLTLSNGETISLTKLKNIAFGLEQLNKNYKIFLQDFKKGKTKFGGKIVIKQYKEELDELKKKLDDTHKISRTAASIGDKTLKEEYTPEFKREVINLISQRNKIARLYNRYIRRYNNLDYLTDYDSK